MSLLLDALQRASKDKERAAGTALQFSEEPGLGASLPPSPAAQGASSQRVDALNDLALAPMHPAPAPQPAPAVQAEPAPPGPAVSPPLAPAAAPTSEAPSPARAVDPPRVARNLLSAHAVAPRPKPRPLVPILGAVALVLAVALGSLMLGFWDKYFPTGQPVGTLPPAVTPNEATAVVAPASTATAVPVATAAASGTLVAPVTAPPKAQPTMPLPLATASQAPSAQPPSPDGARPPMARATGRHKGTAGSSAAPQFAARTTGPGPLEEAYAALIAGRQDEATRMYGEVLKAHPEERDALLGLAYIAHRAGRRDEAAEYYERVLRQEPDHPVAQAGLLALQARVDPALATSRTRDMAARHPESAAALATLGHLLVKEGRLADASQAFTRAQALEPTNPTHAYNLAVALDQLHQYDKARSYYERALSGLATTSSFEPGFSRAAVQQRLEQLRSFQSGRQP